MVLCVSAAPFLQPRRVAVAGNHVRVAERRGCPRQPQRVRLQGEVRVPAEARAGPAAGGGRLSPRHVPPHTVWPVFPTRRRPAPQPAGPHRRRRLRGDAW